MHHHSAHLGHGEPFDGGHQVQAVVDNLEFKEAIGLGRKMERGQRRSKERGYLKKAPHHQKGERGET